MSIAYKRKYRPVKAYQWFDNEKTKQLLRDVVHVAEYPIRAILANQMTTREFRENQNKPIFYIRGLDGPILVRNQDWIVIDRDKIEIYSDREFREEFSSFDDLKFKLHIQIESDQERWRNALHAAYKLKWNEVPDDKNHELEKTWGNLHLTALGVQELESELWHTKLALAKRILGDGDTKMTSELLRQNMDQEVQATVFPRDDKTSDWETIMDASAKIDYLDPFGMREKIKS